MDVYVIRHGHRADKEPDYDGGHNTPLSERGHKQAEALGEFMAGEDLDALYSSCHLRALQTAEPINRALDIEWHAWPVFGEFGNITWRNRAAKDREEANTVTAWDTSREISVPTAQELEERHGNYYRLSDIPDMFPDVKLSQPFPYPEAWWEISGRTRSDGLARVGLGMEALLNRHEDDESIAIVCHTQSGAAIVSTITEFPGRHRFRGFSFDNTGITHLDRRAERQWLIRYANRVCHLPPELRM